MKTKIDNLLIVSPDFKSGNTIHGHDVDTSMLEKFNENTPDRIRERSNGIGLFIPNTLGLSEQLINILSVNKIPKELKEFGAATYYERKSLGISIPKDTMTKEYLYYTLLHEVLDMQNDKNSMREAEQKVLALAKENKENIHKFLRSHLCFFRGSLEAKWPTNKSDRARTLQVKSVISLLEKEIMNTFNQTG